MKTMRPILFTALLAAASLIVPDAHAQPSDADAKQLAVLRVQSEKGEAKSQNDLGLAFSLGKFGLATNYVEAVKWYRKAAEQNHPQALYELGVCYTKGAGVARDAVEAVKWYRKAAGQNYAEAQYNLGVCYDEGAGVVKDELEAVKWYRKAAGQNLAEAQHNLGVCYDNGYGVLADSVEAYKWWLLAAAQEFEPAKKPITVMERQLTREQLAEGQKLASDFKPPEVPSLDAPHSEADGKPLAELRAKAEAGDAKAQNELGETFQTGKLGVRKDAVAAVKWFRQAAAQNLAAAQSNLGGCYERGDGVAKYELEAYKWVLLAAAQGDTKAKRNATLLEFVMSPEEIAAGKRKADDWLEQRKTPAR